jgi:hypothetical protein
MNQSNAQDPADSPDKVIAALAAQHGLVAPGRGDVDDALWAYTMGIVSLCARIADAADGGGGDRIRSALLDYRARPARSNSP